MKHLKEIATGNLVKVSNEKGAEMVASGLFRYSTRGRWKSMLNKKKRNDKHLLRLYFKNRALSKKKQ